MKPSDIAEEFEEKVMGITSVDEENVALVVEPVTCSLPVTGGTSIHVITNTGGERAVFKCSNNKDYRVDYVYGFIEVGGKFELKITRLGGVAKEDKLVIYFTSAANNAKDAKATFIGSNPAGSINILLNSQ